ncbi:hypothetical protein [Photobacterium damselae]|uniref:hypothetical protein n=1 Tax=Photobacterium damselae TaxID=38293 RepID=UPI001F337DFE|nr:hypothetical protein [Photobacterium damselae]UKA04995.1 hypothetical protein IHC89_22375 [Photobacterium damselae subsp. damselae]
MLFRISGIGEYDINGVKISDAAMSDVGYKITTIDLVVEGLNYLLSVPVCSDWCDEIRSDLDKLMIAKKSGDYYVLICIDDTDYITENADYDKFNLLCGYLIDCSQS